MTKLQISLLTGVLSALVSTAVLAAYNPNSTHLSRLDSLNPSPKPEGRKPTAGAGAIDNVSSLIRQPIFVMTTGGNAYKPKDFRLLGVSITPKRKAALISVDGGEAHWIKLGETEADFTLIDIGTNGAQFNTPTGISTVSLNETGSDNSKKEAGRGG